MFEHLYEWLQNISYYLILVTAVTYILPSNAYRKYIRFFTGLVLILMLLTPVMNLFGIEANEAEKYLSEYEKNMPEFVVSTDGYDDGNMTNGSDEGDIEKVGNSEVRIEVEDVVIGP